MSVAFAGNAIYIMLTHDHDDLDRLPGRRPSAGRQDSRSTTSAVIVDLGIGHDCPLSATERFPSPRHEHGTNCQPKWRSSNSPQTFKTKLKSHLFLAAFP